MQTPPEKCPVCGAKNLGWRKVSAQDWRVFRYQCGANYAPPGTIDVGADWYKPCPHAMTAAVRCGATLEPTPLELARTALVDAAVKWLNAVYEVANSDSAGTEQAHFDRRNAADSLLHYVAAYRALLEPAP